MAWSTSDIPPQEGRTAVVTGANSGIGFETAKALALAGADVVLACRSESRAAAAQDAIATSGDDLSVRTVTLDLSRLESVDQCAEEILQSCDRIDLLVNNAGVMMPKKREQTADGFELQIGVNHLGHFKLTSLLFPALMRGEHARVVNVASQAHRMGRLELSDLNYESRRYKRVASYGQSKLANLLFTFELARRLSAAGIEMSSLAAHPGWTSTELQRHTPSARLFNKFLAMKRSDGALPTLRAAVDPASHSGDYFGPSGVGELRGPPVKVGASSRAKSLEDAAALWQRSEELTNTSFEVSASRSDVATS